jgi:hypothetical protein
MAKQAEDPKARINPALLLISIEFHVEIWPNRGGRMGGSSYHTERRACGSGQEHPPTHVTIAIELGDLGCDTIVSDVSAALAASLTDKTRTA